MRIKTPSWRELTISLNVGGLLVISVVENFHPGSISGALNLAILWTLSWLCLMVVASD